MENFDPARPRQGRREKRKQEGELIRSEYLVLPLPWRQLDMKSHDKSLRLLENLSKIICDK